MVSCTHIQVDVASLSYRFHYNEYPINTVKQGKKWDDECKYLDEIDFVCLAEGGKAISLPTDEEGNSEILLTPRAARHVANLLNAACDQIEQGG